jgi:hypothetical protein
MARSAIGSSSGRFTTLGHVLLHHTHRHLQARGNLGIGQSIELAAEEGDACLGRQTVQHAVDGGEGFQDQGPLLRRRESGLGQRRGPCLIGTFEIAAAPDLIQQSLRNRGEQRARLTGTLPPRHLQQLHERLRRHVFRAKAAARLAPHAASQPGVMLSEPVGCLLVGR